MNEQGALTDLGRAVRQWPMAPRFARLLYESCALGVSELGATAAACLSERDFVIDMARLEAFAGEDSDLVARLHLLAEAGGNGRGAESTVLRLSESYFKIADRKARAGTKTAAEAELRLTRALLRSYPDRICRRRLSNDTADGSPKAKMVGGKGIELDRRSLCRQAEYFIALQLRAAGSRADLICTQAHPVPLAMILDEYSRHIIFQTEEFQTENGRWMKREFKLLDQLPLSYPREISLTVEEETERWKVAAAKDPRAHLEQHPDFLDWLRRLEFLQSQNLVQDIELTQEKLDLWLSYWLEGHTSFATVRATSPLPLARLVWPISTLALIENEAPANIMVPSGSRIAVQYRRDNPPILSVRLQEIFGWTTTPRLAQGKVGIVMELLGPNFRPIQITGDLSSFWSATYFEIRKELRLKYPKHSWPEDPLNAKAVAKGRPR